MSYDWLHASEGIPLTEEHPLCVVARSQEPMQLTSLLLSEGEYSEWFDESVEAVLICPIIKSGNQVIAVVEVLYSIDRPNFMESDQIFIHNICIWCGTVMNYTDVYNVVRTQQIVNKYILQVTDFMFANIDNLDAVMSFIVQNMMSLVNATQAAFYSIQEMEFYAHIVNEGDGNGMKIVDDYTVVRHYLDNSITGVVALTGDVVVVMDAKADGRFNKDVDQRPNSVTNSILCVPVKVEDKIVAVLQMLKHDDSYFSKEEAVNCYSYAVYCGLALQVAQMYEDLMKSQRQYTVAMEVLSYHFQVEEKDVSTVNVSDLPLKAPFLLKFAYSPWFVTDKAKILNIIYIYNDLMTEVDLKGVMKDLNVLSRFVFTVRKNHRQIPFHHWDHAYSALQACYAFVKKVGPAFNDEELLAFFIACLCHDIDFKETCMSLLDVNNYNPFGFLYNTPSRNGHNFNVTATILRNSELNILMNLSSDSYKAVLMNIKFCLAATSFEKFFENKFQADLLLLKRGRHGWRSQEERFILMGVCMTSFDMCNFYKPWEIHFMGLILDLELFYEMTDEQLSQYAVNLSVMEKENVDIIPDNMITFMNSICLPCYQLIGQLFPKVNTLPGFCRITRARYMEFTRLDREKRKTEWILLREKVLSRNQPHAYSGQLQE